MGDLPESLAVAEDVAQRRASHQPLSAHTPCFSNKNTAEEQSVNILTCTGHPKQQPKQQGIIKVGYI